MSIFIVVYLLTVLCGYLLSLLVSAIRYFPVLVIYTIFLPVAPFYVAYKNRKEYPKAAKFIYVSWGIIYLLLVFIFYMNGR